MTQARSSVKCKNIFESMEVTRAEAEYFAKSTSLQSGCLLWYEHMIGRLTASKFRSICRTMIQSLSPLLVSSILTCKYVSIASSLNSEVSAHKQYVKRIQQSHQNFSAKVTGLHINLLYPNRGASPDGMISSDMLWWGDARDNDCVHTTCETIYWSSNKSRFLYVMECISNILCLLLSSSGPATCT